MSYLYTLRHYSSSEKNTTTCDTRNRNYFFNNWMAHGIRQFENTYMIVIINTFLYKFGYAVCEFLIIQIVKGKTKNITRNVETNDE